MNSIHIEEYSATSLHKEVLAGAANRRDIPRVGLLLYRGNTLKIGHKFQYLLYSWGTPLSAWIVAACRTAAKRSAS